MAGKAGISTYAICFNPKEYEWEWGNEHELDGSADYSELTSVHTDKIAGTSPSV